MAILLHPYLASKCARNEIAAVILVSGAHFLSAFEKGQVDTLAYLLFLRLHGQGFVVASQIFLGVLAISVRDSYH